MSNVKLRPLDWFWRQTLFKLLPTAVSPNFFTYWRLALIPVVLLLLVRMNFVWALAVFVVAAILDTIDGALARYRKQVSFSGQLLDPLADKLLVVLTVLFLMFFYPWPMLLLAAMIFDFLLGIGAAMIIFVFKEKKILSSDIFGKTKMVMAAVSIFLVFAFLIFKSSVCLWLSAIGLILTAVLGGISFLIYGIKIALDKK